MTPPRRVAAFRLDEDLLQGLERVWEGDRVQPSETIRRATRAWLEVRGILKKAERRRAIPRERS